MAVRRVLIFTCDNCGTEIISNAENTVKAINEQLEMWGWEGKNSNRHICLDCIIRKRIHFETGLPTRIVLKDY